MTRIVSVEGLLDGSTGAHPASRGKARKRLAAAYADARRYLRRKYVTGVGIGYVMECGLCTNEIGISIHVTAKLDDAFLSKAQRFPRTLRGIRVDVVQSNFSAHLSDAEFHARQRNVADPLRPGILIKTGDGNVGTIGLLVTSLVDGHRYVLSSGHVLDAPGATVYQPNKTLAPVPLADVTMVRGSPNDAAIARYSGRGFRDIPLGTSIRINSVRRAAIGDILRLSGAMTGVTNGKVVWVGTRDMVYGPGDIRRVNGFQLEPATSADPATERGDSGALWFDPAGAGVGLHVGGAVDGGNAWSFACHLDDVMASMQLSL